MHSRFAAIVRSRARRSAFPKSGAQEANRHRTRYRERARRWGSSRRSPPGRDATASRGPSQHSSTRRRGIEKAAHRRKHFRFVEKEGIVSAIRFDLDEADIGSNRVQGMGDTFVLAGGKKPVAGERDDAEARFRAPEG